MGVRKFVRSFTVKPARKIYRAVRRSLIAPTEGRQLTEALRRSGIKPADLVMVHASLSQMGNVRGGPRMVIASLIDAVTPQGAILMPAYMSAKTVGAMAARGEIVDLRTAPSATGAITEAFRQWPGVYRSSHPFSSVCAWGAKARYLTEGHARDERICHRDSPLGRLWELQGKILGIGVSLAAVSFFHVLEDTWEGFPLPVYLPPQAITYVDAEGKTITRMVKKYNPEISKTRMDRKDSIWIREQLTEHFIKLGIMRRFQFSQASSWVMEAAPFYREIKRLAERGITVYLTQAEWEARSGGQASW